MNVSEMTLWQLAEIKRIIDFRLFIKLLPIFAVSVALYALFLLWSLRRK